MDVPPPLNTICGRCGLYYMYPLGLDYEQNLCPQCHHSNNGHLKVEENFLKK
ncbi:MAG: hypothetical protein ACK4GQ_03495 [Candidatus Hadarchaeales archaeon]